MIVIGSVSEFMLQLEMNHRGSHTFFFFFWKERKYLLHGNRSEVENRPYSPKWDPCFSAFSIYVCPSITDVWAAWAPGGSVTGTRRTTYVSLKMTQSTTCSRWVILSLHFYPSTKQTPEPSHNINITLVRAARHNPHSSVQQVQVCCNDLESRQVRQEQSCGNSVWSFKCLNCSM